MTAFSTRAFSEIRCKLRLQCHCATLFPEKVIMENIESFIAHARHIILWKMNINVTVPLTTE